MSLPPQSVLLQEGSYGCAFSPPLQCKKSKVKTKVNTKVNTKVKTKKIKKRIVGKLMLEKDAEIELSIAELVRSIPGYERYFIVQEKDNCVASNFKKLRDDYEDKCNVLKKHENKDLIQLLSPFGGTPLYELSVQSSFDFIGSLRHMLEGILKLQQQGICHFDLHTGNILVDSHETMRIIDFGAAFVGDQVTQKNLWLHIYDFSPEYDPQPPELSVMNGLYSKKPLLQSIVDTVKYKKVMSITEQILGYSLEEQENDLRIFWKSDTTYNGGSWIPFFHKYWLLWDNWSIGVIFVKLLQKALFNPSFVKKTWSVYGLIIRKVLKGLLHPNPMRRLTAEKALSLLSS
jgi:serine/threonine protein kinase